WACSEAGEFVETGSGPSDGAGSTGRDPARTLEHSRKPFLPASEWYPQDSSARGAGATTNTMHLQGGDDGPALPHVVSSVRFADRLGCHVLGIRNGLRSCAASAGERAP